MIVPATSSAGAGRRCADPSVAGISSAADGGVYEQPLVVPQPEQTKQAPARCMTTPQT